MKHFLTFFSLFCCGVVAAYGQSADLQPVVASDSVTIAQLSAEVGQLRQHSERRDKALSYLPRVSGYLQAGYEGATGSSTFLVKSVRVWMNGNLGTPKLNYMLQLELASPRLLDAFICYRPFDALNLQVGQFKLPFTIENTEYTPLNFEFIDYPMGLFRLGGLGPHCSECMVSGSGRDLGAMASGGFLRRSDGGLIINYNLAVINGEGINMRDVNKSKDIVGRLMIRPVAGLTLAGYYYWGEQGSHYDKRIRYGGGACYDKGCMVFRGEYIGGITGEDGSDMTSDSWYAVAGVRPAKGLMIAARYDTFLGDRDNRNTRQTNYTMGLTWEPVKFLRCQLDYIYEDFSAADVRNRNVVALMFTGIF